MQHINKIWIALPWIRWISDEKFFNWIVNRLISTKIYSFDTTCPLTFICLKILTDSNIY